MYESPVKQILGEMQVTYENECLKAIQSYGFDVNKEELVKALEYDRNQYDKGYKDGYVEGIDKFAEVVKKEYEQAVSIPNMEKETAYFVIDEMAKRMKQGGK